MQTLNAYPFSCFSLDTAAEVFVIDFVDKGFFAIDYSSGYLSVAGSLFDIKMG